MNDRPESKAGFYAGLSISLLGVLATGLAAGALGKDVNWDLRNYHLYNAFAFVTERLTQDVAPAQLQSYQNPLLDLPFFWLSQRFHSLTVGVILGLVQGLNIPLVFLIAWRVLRTWGSWWRSAVAIGLAGVGGFAPIFIAEIGTTFQDNVVSLFVLLAVLIPLLRDYGPAGASRERAYVSFLVSGMIMGLGVGLKPTVAVYAISLVPAALFLCGGNKEKVVAILSYGIGGVVGVAATAGFWMWEMWVNFGNPLFPYANDVFLSPYIDARPLTISRFGPENLLEALVWPILFSYDSHRVLPLEFTGWRFAIIYVVGLALLGMTAWRVIVRRGVREVVATRLTYPAYGNLLLVFVVVSFVLWMMMASVYRYLVVLELVGPLVLFVLWDRLLAATRHKIAAMLLSAVVICVLVRPANWGRESWTEDYFEFYVEPHGVGGDSVVLMLGSAPMAYVIPSFPETVSFLRAEGNLPLREGNLLLERIRQKLGKASGSVYFLYSGGNRSVDAERSANYWGYVYQEEKCRPLKGNVTHHLLLCKVTKRK